MEAYEGISVTYLDVDTKGLVDLDQLKEAIRPETSLISIMHSNNETGVIQPLRKIRQIVQGKDIYIFSDATQSLGKVDLDDLFDVILVFVGVLAFVIRKANMYFHIIPHKRSKIAFSEKIFLKIYSRV